MGRGSETLGLRDRLRDTYAAYRRNRVTRSGLIMVAVLVIIAGGGRPTLLNETVLALLLLDIYASRSMARDGSLARSGFPRTGAVKGFALGALVAAAVISATVGVFALAGWYEVETFDLNLTSFAYYTALFLMVSVAEEVLARGLIWRFVERRAGTLAALVASSLLFGLGHFMNPNATWWSGLAIGLHAGLLLGALFIVTRSLWYPIGAHFAWNLFEGPVFGTEVSGMDSDVLIEASTRGPEIWTGGAFGPEASVITVVLGALPALVLLGYAWKHRMFSGRDQQAATRATTSPVPSERD